MSESLPDIFRKDAELIRLTIEQVQKDLGNHLSELHFSGAQENVFEELVSQIAAALCTVRQMPSTVLQSILYRVDISENEFREIKNAGFENQLAEKIVRREFKKVLTRHFYSGKKD